MPLWPSVAITMAPLLNRAPTTFIRLTTALVHIHHLDENFDIDLLFID